MPESAIKPECWTCPCFAVWDCPDCPQLKACQQRRYGLSTKRVYPEECAGSDCVAAKKAHYLAMRSALERLEFVDHGHGGDTWKGCVECGGTPESGHLEGCFVGEALGRFGKAGGPDEI